MVKRQAARKPKRRAKAEARTPTGPHTPISNLVTGTPTVTSKLVSPAEVGTAAGSVDLAKMAERAPAPESAAAAPSPQAPKTNKLQDIGRASFRDPGVTLESVHGPDNRMQVHETAKYPFRAIASLLITAKDGSQWVGTGWFISPRTLITAGHCVYITNSPVLERNGWVKSIQVLSGRNAESLPFGGVTSTQFWTVTGWADSGDENFDYGAIVVPTELGKKVGIFGFASLSDDRLMDAVALVTGYPADKDDGTMWTDTKQIAAVGASKVHYDIDTAGGQSGAPVYEVEDGKPVVVAVHAYGGATTNSGTRISPPVFNNLTNWKA
jgi:glutamyl endopeptidase